MMRLKMVTHRLHDCLPSASHEGRAGRIYTRPLSFMGKKSKAVQILKQKMNTRVNIYIFTQICRHIYFRPDLVQQSQLSVKLIVGIIVIRKEKGKEDECGKKPLATQYIGCTGTGLLFAALGTAGGDSSVLQLVCYIAFLHDAT